MHSFECRQFVSGDTAISSAVVESMCDTSRNRLAHLDVDQQLTVTHITD